VIACLAEEDFAYQDWGLLDKTHIRFFGIKNIQRLFTEAGYVIVNAEFVVVSPERTELGNRWRNAPAALKRGLSANRFGMVYQVVVQATPHGSPDNSIDLLKLVVPPPSSMLGPDATFAARLAESLRDFVRPYLSPGTRTRLRNALERLKSFLLSKPT
jgi:hypothetical protein